MICDNCNTEHNGSYGSGRFCGVKCARGFATKANRERINQKRSASLKNRPNPRKGRRTSSHWHPCQMCGTDTKAKHFCSVVCMKQHTELTRDAFTSYRLACSFTFNVYDFPDVFDLKLVEQHGWYSAANRGGNVTGVSRDHKLSVAEGFLLNIDPEIMKHPANCELMLHSLNSSKKTNSSITVEELMTAIENW